MKILFISSNITHNKNGGSVCSKRNLETLQKIVGNNNVKIITLLPFSAKRVSFSNLIRTVINSLFLRINGTTCHVVKEIISTINKEKITYVFIDSSLNGYVAKRIKIHTSAQTISFFHNCEFKMILEQVKGKNYWAVPRLYSVYFNERLTCKYSNKVIVLNQRDKDLIERYYRKKADYIIPISLPDKINNNEVGSKKITNYKKALFIGSYFFGNIEGLQIFIKEVLPYVSVELTIVGNGMSALQNSTPKIRIFDNVEDLMPFYLNADFVIAPIISGGGMKVKIAEAMMYGKIIIGTDEAFQGYYNIPNSYICNTPQQFIDIINSITGKNYHRNTRELFLKKYSLQATLAEFAKIIK